MRRKTSPLLLLTLASTLASSGTERGERLSRYGCEGTTLHLSCPEGQLLQVVRANYGRFSLEVCNKSGNTSWSFNCIQHQTKAVLDRRCSNLPECTFQVTSQLFGGDPCPGTGKYIEVHYQCQSQPSQTSAPPAPPPWLLDLSATPPPRRFTPPPTSTTASRPSTTSSPISTPTPSRSSARPTKRQYYVFPPESQSKEGDAGRKDVEEVEAEQKYLVLGIAVAVSAVATVLTFILCYQVWRRCRAKAQTQSRLCQACSCQNVFYSYYESGGSGQTSSTEVKSVGEEECAYQLPYMLVMRQPPTLPPSTLGPSQAGNIYMEIEPGDAIAPLSAPPRPSSAPMLQNSPSSNISVIHSERQRQLAEGLPGLSPIQIAFNETGQQFLHLNIQQPGEEGSKL